MESLKYQPSTLFLSSIIFKVKKIDYLNHKCVFFVKNILKKTNEKSYVDDNISINR